MSQAAALLEGESHTLLVQEQPQLRLVGWRLQKRAKCLSRAAAKAAVRQMLTMPKASKVTNCYGPYAKKKQRSSSIVVTSVLDQRVDAAAEPEQP
eukprot:4251661-Pleurochrysis_carterae.AAC.1